MLVPSLPFRNIFFGNSSEKLHMEDVGLFIIPEKNHICCMEERRLYLKIFINLTPKTLNSIINYNQT